MKLKMLITMAALFTSLATVSVRAGDFDGEWVGLIGVDTTSVLVTLYKPQLAVVPVAGTACYNANSGDKSRYEVRLKSTHPFFKEIFAMILTSYSSRRKVSVSFTDATCEITTFVLQ